MTVLLLVLEIILILIFLSVLCLVFLWMWSALRTKDPFMPVPMSIMGHIHKALNVNNQSVVYDLGCGDARVLLYESRFYPKATYVGFEIAPFPLLLARIQSWWSFKRTKIKIEIIKQDFFTANISEATHLFTYLYPRVMDTLLPKLDKELKPGTRLISVSYKFTTKQPTMVINLNRSSYKLARTLYIYEF